MDVLLVGEDRAFLRLLALELSSRGFRVSWVADIDSLVHVLGVLQPDFIVFDHVEPMDVFMLNPREQGYEGPLVLLIEDEVPPEMAEILEPHHVARKSGGLENLLHELTRIVFSPPRRANHRD